MAQPEIAALPNEYRVEWFAHTANLVCSAPDVAGEDWTSVDIQMGPASGAMRG